MTTGTKYGVKDDPLVDEVMDAFTQMSAARANLETHWNEIAELLWPDMRDSFTFGSTRTPYDKRADRQLDTTPQLALQNFGAILDSMLTPRNQKWHRLTTTNEDLNKVRQVQLWYEQASNLLFKHRYAATANFASQNQNNYQLLGAFGTGTLYIDPLVSDYGKGLRYKSCPVGEIHIRENHQGIVDTVLRRWSMTAKQAMNEFGDRTPEEIVEKARQNKDAIFSFIHYVCPQYDHDPGAADYRGKRYRSVKISVEARAVLGVSGYNVFPWAISRYTQAPGEDYGRSPGMQALAAMKTLNAMKRAALMQQHRASNPVYLSHDDGIIDQLRLRPGLINRGGISADGRLLVQPLPVGNVEVNLDAMERERAEIKQAFLVHLFEIAMGAENIPDRMNVPQVLERMREKGILLAPTIGRQQSEYLGPMIQRELDVLSQLRLLPPMPPELREAEGDYDVTYDSPLSRAMRAEETAGFVQAIEFATQIANATGDPSVLDPYNLEVALPALAENWGVPASWMRDKTAIDGLKAARAQQAERQQQAAEAGPAAALIGAAAKAKQAGVDVGS